MPDGSRVNAIIPPLALDGPVLSIRRFGAELTIDQLLEHRRADRPRWSTLLAGCVQARLNILISGGTGSGKTTLLNALSSFIPASERIVTIEDAAELRLQQDHVVRLETRPPNAEGRGEVMARDLVKNALRMRPDRIIVGEVRGAEALDMLQAMNTGHEGSLTTIHANTPRDAMARLETMILFAGTNLPNRAMREQISSALDVIIQVSRLSDGTRRIDEHHRGDGHGRRRSSRCRRSSASGGRASRATARSSAASRRPACARRSSIGSASRVSNLPANLFAAGS